jgi:hypothetical protein
MSLMLEVGTYRPRIENPIRADNTGPSWLTG